jgi:flagellin
MKRVLAALAVLWLPQTALATPGTANLVANGAFTTGSFSGWSLGGNAEYLDVESQSYDGYAAPVGGNYALLGPVGSDGTLTQPITDMAGERLSFSFYLAGDGGTPNDFSASFDGATLLHVVDQPAQGWTFYDFTVLGTGHDSVSFAFRDDPGYWGLDGVSITADAPVPEPSASLGFGTGIAGFAAWRWRTRARKT